MTRRDLPDIYALDRGPQAWGRGHTVYFRQILTGHGKSDIYVPRVLTKTCIGLFGSLYKRLSEFLL